MRLFKRKERVTNRTSIKGTPFQAEQVEWDSFVHTKRLPVVDSERMFQFIQGHKEPVVRPMLLKVLRIAAVILLPIAALYLLFRPAASVKHAVAHPLTDAVVVATNKVVLSNTGAVVKKFWLNDRSLVVLSPKSTLVLQQPFDGVRRDMWLNGEATFYVAKHPGRPFTVYTKGFSTTALGTVFRVRAYADNKLSSVCLLKGKVVVRNLLKSDVAHYLTAGQGCSFDSRLGSLSRNVFFAAKVDIKERGDMAAEELAFNNEPLPAVLKTLGTFYDIPILYSTAALKSRKYTGHVRKEQALQEVLTTIALLNDLVVVKEGAGFRVVLNK